MFIVGIWAPAAEAAPQTVSWSVSGKSYSCTVTALQPTFNSTSKYITISASVTCTLSTTVSVYLKLVEMDGTSLTTEDSKCVMTTSGCADFITSGSAGTTSKTWTYTIQKACISTETDGEEYATKAAVSVTSGGKVFKSSYDRTVPTLNQFSSC